MIKKIYNNASKQKPWMCFIFILTCCLTTVPTAFDNSLFYIFAANGQPTFIWQYFTGIFEHSIFPRHFIWIHFLGNMSFIIVFGILVEKVIGTKRTFVLGSLGGLSSMLLFYMRNIGSNNNFSGASGVAYVFAPIALYCLIYIIKNSNYKYIKDPLFYILVFEFIFAWIFITINSTFWGTNIYHLVSTIIGLAFIVFNKNYINHNIELILKGQEKRNVNDFKFRYLLLIFPMLISSILIQYKLDNFDLFLEPSYISKHDTTKDIQANGDRIEIRFNEKITQFRSISASGPDPVEITYSEDGQKVYCIFEENTNGSYKLILSSAKAESGKIVKDILITVND